MIGAPIQNHGRGIALSCAGFTAWAVSDACIKLAGQSLATGAVIFISVLCAALCTLSLAALQGGIGQVRTRRFGFHALRGLCCVVAFYFCVLALNNLPMASFYMVVFISPLLVALLEMLVLRQRSSALVWFAILFGFAGVIVAALAMHAEAPGEQAAHSATLFGIMAALVNATAYSIIVVMTRYARDENNYALSFWPDALIAPCAFAMMLWQGDGQFDVAGIAWAALSGVFGCLGFYMTNAALRLAPAAIVSPYHYTQIISGALLGYLIWQHIPPAGVVIGAGMIIISGMMVLRETKSNAA